MKKFEKRFWHTSLDCKFAKCSKNILTFKNNNFTHEDLSSCTAEIQALERLDHSERGFDFFQPDFRIACFKPPSSTKLRWRRRRRRRKLCSTCRSLKLLEFILVAVNFGPASRGPVEVGLNLRGYSSIRGRRCPCSRSRFVAREICWRRRRC